MIEIRVISATAKPDGDEPVRRRKERSPALELADVGHLVRTAAGQALGIPGEEDVSERHRGAALVQRAAAEESAHDAAVDFEDAAAKPHGAAGRRSEDCEREADDRDGEGPEIADDSRSAAAFAGGVEQFVSPLCVFLGKRRGRGDGVIGPIVSAVRVALVVDRL